EPDERGDTLPDESRDGGDVRSRPRRPPASARAVRSRDGRADPGAVAAMAPPRPDPPRRALCEEPEDVAGPLHRLRLARPVPNPLRNADPVEAARRARRAARVRGVRRHALRYRPPDGPEPAVPSAGARVGPRSKASVTGCTRIASAAIGTG